MKETLDVLDELPVDQDDFMETDNHPPEDSHRISHKRTHERFTGQTLHPTHHAFAEFVHSPADFTKLRDKYPSLQSYTWRMREGSFSMDFSDPQGTVELTKVLLKEYYDVEWDIPVGQLVPPVPCRAKYIIWMHDLLQLMKPSPEKRVVGLDVGCGANCIYPLLGSSMYGWHFVGSDITDVAIYHAQQNVHRNMRFRDTIRIVKVPEAVQEILIPVTQNHGPFDFCMCNPPFFSSIKEAGQNQKTAFGGTSTEMVYPGGEGAFVQKMVEESTTLGDQIIWYSAMMGKKSTFKTIRKMLYTVGPAALRTTTFEQGKMTRWAIAWSFVAKNTDDKPLKPILPSTPIIHVHPHLPLHTPTEHPCAEWWEFFRSIAVHHPTDNACAWSVGNDTVYPHFSSHPSSEPFIHPRIKAQRQGMLFCASLRHSDGERSFGEDFGRCEHDDRFCVLPLTSNHCVLSSSFIMDAENPSAANPEIVSRSTEKEEECSVCVAVNIRPLIGNELVEGCQECLDVDAGLAQVSACGKNFLFDRVYGSCNASPPQNLFLDCIHPLVEALFKGYNATVLAYGQTGSGKTYTMGSAFTPGQPAIGVIPSVLDQIFDRIKTMPLVECTVRASFVEIHKEEIRDLLVFGENQAKLNRTTSVSVREMPGGGVCLAGATEREVTSKEQTGELLMQGSQFRATASTNMNSRSSRSHAIFTITLEQRKQVALTDDSQKNSDEEEETTAPDEDVVDDFLTAKMHLVDLAGSERAKRTKAEGQRLKEGIDINKGLLALGKVISSLVEHHRHVPYRDSKLTRLLQDSLGGNSRTVMIACVSPADINMEESINTLRYANQARAIKNKPVVNRDPVAAQFAYLRQQLALARSELAMYKKAGNGEEIQLGVPDPYLQEELENSEKQRKQLESENARLKIQLESALRDAKESRLRQVDAQCKCDTFNMKYNQLKKKLDQLEADGVELPDPEETLDNMGSEDVIQGYLDRIAELEQENHTLKDLKAISHDFMQRASMGQPASHNAMPFQRTTYMQIPELEDVDQDLVSAQMAAAEEEAYRLEQQRLGEELVTLEKSLEMKEMQIKKVTASSTQVEALRQQFEKQLRSLENKRTKLEKERQDLAMKLQNMKAMSHEEQLRLEEHYRHQLKEKDEELKELKKKEKEFMKLERLKRKTEDACSKLRSDVERIKAQKVKLHKQIELKNKEHNDKMKMKEREMMHLKKQNRVAQAKLQRIEALHSKQQTVLRRKTEEAEAARRRLKEISANNRNQSENKNRRANSETPTNQGGSVLRDDKARLEWLEQELDSCNQSLVLKRVLDGEVEQRKHVSRQMFEIEKRLEHVNGATSGDHVPVRLAETHQTLQKRKSELEAKIAHHSSQIAEVQKMYEQARSSEERTGSVNDVKRWNGIRTVAEARSLLKILFKLASDQKVVANDYYSDNAQLAEESTELQEKLEIMTQEIQALRRNLVRAEAAAVAAVSLSSKFGPSQQTQDKSDSDVEDLLQQISDVATTPHRRKTINVMLREQNGHVDADAVEDGHNHEGKSLCLSGKGGLRTDVHQKRGVSDSSDDSEWEAEDEEDHEASPNGMMRPKQPANAVNKAQEKEVLHFINVRLARRGEVCSQRLTIPLMEKELKLTIPKWHRGHKARDALVDEIRTRLMNQGTGHGKSAGYSDSDKPSAKVHVPENLKCVTPHAREFLEKRDEMITRLERIKSKKGRPHSAMQSQEPPPALN